MQLKHIIFSTVFIFLSGLLYAGEEDPCFRIAAVGDIQVGNTDEINYANQTILVELMERKDIGFSVFLGDLVNDNPSLFPYMKEMMELLPFPSRAVFGNHDRDLGLQGIQDSIFRVFFGPSFYSFDYKQVHFIVLNNVYPQGKKGYEGRYTDEQIQWMNNDLKKVVGDRLIVICQHIPLIYTKNNEDLIRLLKGRKQVLVLSAHTHQVSRHFLSGENVLIHELVAGASCGNWWVGEKDWQGIPSALMQCGSPRNYFLIDFEEDHYRIHFKGVGLDPGRQMDVWVGGQDTLDNHIGLPENIHDNVVANIYGASDSTIVCMQIDQGSWITMNHTKMVAPAVSRILARNKEDIYPTAYSRKSALRTQVSPHIWTASLPGNLSPGIHSVRISARDTYGFEVTGERMFIFNH